MQHYIGRFAPSPTGPLHFGSLVAAVASYLQARSQNGTWLVRIEDLDPPRESPTAIDEILKALDAHGFDYSTPLRQSERHEVYAAALEALLDQQLAYPCSCTRKQLRANPIKGRVGIVYPGTCRDGLLERDGNLKNPPLAVRQRIEDEIVTFTDTLQGEQGCNMAQEIGDMLIRRGDGLFAYHLAVVVDDAFQGITEIVRGTDLLDTTFAQIVLQRQLGLSQPGYMHFPIAVDSAGKKLSKQTFAPEIDIEKPVENIYKSLIFLKQNPPDALTSASITEVWDWAIAHWNPKPLEGLRTLPA